jgi:hypothetical protein
VKKTFYILAIASLLFACNKGDDPVIFDNSEHLLLDQMKGRYNLEQLYTDVPLDLNFDGEYNTDLYLEIDCVTMFPLALTNATVQYYASSGFRDMGLEVPDSYVYSDVEPYSQCFSQVSYVYEFDVNVETKELEITWRFEEPEIESGPLTAARWQDDKLYFEFDKIYFTSEGWQTVKLYVVYVKNNEN